MKKRIILLNVFIVTMVLIFGFTGCDSRKEEKRLKMALELAGENRGELQKVLDHYKRPKDSLKLKAAKFLISNMPYHSHKTIDQRFNSVFRKMAGGKLLTADPEYRKSEFKKRMRNHKNYLTERDSMPSNKVVKEIESLKADFLINNIELAFEAWYKIPKSKRASFHDFCNYILPYKSFNEPVEMDSRSKLYKKFSWVYDELDKGIALNKVVEQVALKFDFNVRDVSQYYSVPQSVSQLEKSRLGVCDDAVNYLVNVFRSLGIVSAKDYVTHMGNHYSKGHSWVYLKYDDIEYSLTIGGDKDAKEIYKDESIGKVYRVSFEYQDMSCFSPLAIDVTPSYLTTANIKIDNLFKIDIEKPVLCVYDGAKEWEVVSSGTNSWGKSKFLNVGVNVLYLAASINNYGNITPFNYPFYINRDKEIQYFNPKDSMVNSVELLRKYGLSSARDRRKVDWMINLNGAEIQVSNDKDFNNFEVLYKIKNFRSSHLQKVNFKSSEKYKYVRFKSNNKEESYLATLAFYDDKMNKLNQNPFEENLIIGNRRNKINIILDDNPLTFAGGEDFVLGMEFNEPTLIGAIEFQARNDGNHIDIGDDYELFYWDKNWKSLGMQKAKDTVLYYDVPKNSLLWLKNLTKGKEEHVFTINENKKQKWLGFDNF
ncbi:hypothetical protein J1D01_16380 [Seonamhaeicola sp. NFXS20]|uniref:hypothetical protein n=1 Tax=Seonamhaeicola sp. NFXS20 TaxID=2816959 RepID=UPI003B8C4DA8